MKLTKLFPMSCNKFLLLLGDDKARLLYLSNNKLMETVHIKARSQSDLVNLAKTLLKDSKAPIFILLNNIDQNYKFESYPAVSMFTLRKMLSNKLEHNYHSQDFKATIVNKTSRQVNFASVIASDWLKEWFDFVMNKDNPFTGMYLLPIEMQTILQRIRLFTELNSPKVTWQFLIIDTEIGGARLVVYKDTQLIFTRLINIARDDQTASIAASIMQEIINTLHYAERFSFKNSDLHEIYLILAPELKNQFIKQGLISAQMIILTPFELAKKLFSDKHDICTEDEPYADICVATYLATNNDFRLKLRSEIIDELSKWSLIKKIESCVMTIALPCILIYLTMCAINLYTIQRENKLQISKETDLATQVVEHNDKLNKVNEGQKVSDAFTLYKLLTASKSEPLSLISEFRKQMPVEVKVESFTWQIDENRDSLSLELEFENHGDEIKELLVKVDLFIANLQKHFVNGEVFYQRELDNIDLDEVTETIPLQVTIKLKDKKSD